MRYSKYELQIAILKVYNQDKTQAYHKYNVIGGRAGYSGSIEVVMRTQFTNEERVLAGQAFQELQNRMLLVPSYTDTAEPGEWLKITPSGERALQTGALDELDTFLLGLGSSDDLLKLRYGAYDAIISQHTDWQRHASSSCRKLITKVLHTVAPDSEVKNDPNFKPEPTASNDISRAERVRHYLRGRKNNDSKNDVDVTEKACALVESCYKKLSAGTHADITEIKSIIKLTEDALFFLLNS